MKTAIYEDAVKEAVELGGIIDIWEEDIKAAFRFEGESFQNIGYSNHPDRMKRNVEAFENAIKDIDVDLNKVNGIVVVYSSDEGFVYDEFEAVSDYIHDKYRMKHEKGKVLIIQSSNSIQVDGTSRVFVALTGIKR